MTREEAEKYLKYRMCSDCSTYLGGKKCIDNCKVIKTIKSLEQELKIGQWIQEEETDEAEPFIIWRCSKCNEVQRRKTKYCPNCGAKMEVEE